MIRFVDFKNIYHLNICNQCVGFIMRKGVNVFSSQPLGESGHKDYCHIKEEKIKNIKIKLMERIQK